MRVDLGLAGILVGAPVDVEEVEEEEKAGASKARVGGAGCNHRRRLDIQDDDQRNVCA